MDTTFNLAELELHHFEYQDASIAYRVIGEGSALVLVPGWPVFGYTWRNVVPLLSKHLTCYVLDMPGLGASKWNDKADLGWPSQAKRLVALITHLQLNNPSIIAQNSGGAIARLVALELKSKLKNLILINTEVPHHRPPWIPLYQTMSKLPLATIGFRMLMKSSLFRKSSMGFKGFYYNTALIDDPTYILPYINPLLQSSHKLKGAMRFLVGCDLSIVDNMEKSHAEIAANILLLWGKNDPTFPINEGRKLEKQFRQCTFVEIEKAGLMPHEEHPEQIAKEVLQFLQV